jgi:THO complex subunit 1
MDTKFKGRIQMALASIFPISDKSGVNIKGLYNKNNYSFSSELKEGNHSNSNKLINSKFYKQFWILLKFLSNPLAIFSNEVSDNTDMIESLDQSKESIVIENDITQNKFDIFLVNMNKIISFFNKNKINLNDNSESILTYPKYLTSPDLFDLQLNDSSFRKTILLQFLILLKSFLKPISQIQKKSFLFNDQEKNQINETIEKIMILLNPNKNPHHYLNLILNDEEMWEKWKEGSCQTYEKFFDENTLKDFQKYMAEYDKKKSDSIEKKFLPIKAKTLFKVDTSQINNELNKHLDFNMEEFQKFEINHTYFGGIQSDNPFIGDYLERLLKDNDPTNGIEDEFKITNSDSV